MTQGVRIRAEIAEADPDVARFVLDRAVAAAPLRFETADEAEGTPLAGALLAIEGVRRVALNGSAIIVGKAPAAAWSALKPAVAAAIRAALPGHDAAAPVAPADTDEDATLLAAVRRALDGAANPAVAKHGGRIDVVAVENSDVMLRMSGGCQGCAASSATLRDGVERILRATVPGIGRIVDVTDHAAGRTPYFGRGAIPASALAPPPGALAVDDGGWTIDAGHLATRFSVPPEDLRSAMRAGRVASIHEIGEGDDRGFTRLIVRWGRRVWRAIVGADGVTQEAVGELGDAADEGLAGRVRSHLMCEAPERLPLAYGALAEALGVAPPHAIGRVARALEATMREDAAAGRPFIAALVVGRARGGIPAPGFFELAAALGSQPASGESPRDFHARLFAAALQMRDSPGQP